MANLTRKLILAALAAALLFTLSSCASLSDAEERDGAKNVIVFIGDGMGLGEVAAAAYTRNGMGDGAQGLFFERFPVTGYCTTHSSDSLVTDSAAAGTALATGVKTNNGVIGFDPDGNRLTTIMEIANGLGRATGVVSSVQLNHATPACYRAHTASRSSYDEILEQYITEPFLQVVLGGGIGLEEMTADSAAQRAAQEAEYHVFTMANVAELSTVAPGDRIFGFFDANDNGHLDYPLERAANPTAEPLLIDLSLAAINALSADPDGFVVMIEGGAIDWTGHANEIENNIDEVLEFDRAIQAVVERLEELGELDDTLIIVTADHETGGLTLPGPYRATLGAGEMPEVNWASTNHTATPVMVWATGPGAERCMGRLDNTDIFRAALAAIEED